MGNRLKNSLANAHSNAEADESNAVELSERSLWGTLLDCVNDFINWFWFGDNKGVVLNQSAFHARFPKPIKKGFYFNNEITMQKTKPLRITSSAASKLFSYTNSVKTEIGGLLVIEERRGEAVVTDALLIQQTASGSNFKADKKSLSKQLYELALTNPAILEKIKGWWHSHADMETFWSPLDDACFEDLLKTAPAVYGVVVNKKGEIRTRLDIKTSLGAVSVCKADYCLGKAVPMVECLAEAKQKVKVPRYCAILGTGSAPVAQMDYAWSENRYGF